MNTLIILSAKYLYIVVILVAMIYFFQQNLSKKKEIAWVGIISLILTYIVAKIGSFLYFDPRPFTITHITPLIAHVADNGFPSDHTLISAAFAAIIFAYDKKIGIILWVLTLLVAISRVAAGVHHIVDIVGSMIIAASVTAVVYYFILPKLPRNSSGSLE